MLGMVAVVTVLLFGLIQIVSNLRSPDEIEVAQNAAREAEKIQERLQEVLSEYPNIDQMINLYTATRLMRDALEQACSATVPSESEIVGKLLLVAETPILAAAGFGIDDLYTICIYQAVLEDDGVRNQLKLVEHLRKIGCDKASARAWPEGRGVTGVAFSKAAEIVVPDLQSPTAQSIFGTSEPALHRDYDLDRYASIVSVPIMVEGQPKPWGVVSATNDLIGHFNHEDEPSLKNEEAIRALAQYAALAVAVYRGCARAAGPSPGAP
jgi:hypothetical protein